MATLIITEKTSQAKDLRAALGDRFGQILPAEGHLLRLAEPDEVDPAGNAGRACCSSRTASIPRARPRSGNKPPS